MARWIIITIALSAMVADAQTIESLFEEIPSSLTNKTARSGAQKAQAAPTNRVTAVSNEIPAEAVFGLSDDEAQRIISGLAKKNEDLRKENLALKKQVRTLTHSLAAEMARADELMFQRQSPAMKEVRLGIVRPSSLSAPIRLVDVNASLNVAVLNAGAVEGVKPGMLFSIRRNNKERARLRALDVREHLSGAELIDFRKGEYPAPGDQAIPLVSGSK